jgi:hypothetical protein
MTDSVYVNSDRSKVVPEGSPEAAYRIHTKEAKRLGILKEPKANKIVEKDFAAAVNVPTATASATNVEPEQPEPNGDKPKRTYTRRATKD